MEQGTFRIDTLCDFNPHHSGDDGPNYGVGDLRILAPVFIRTGKIHDAFISRTLLPIAIEGLRKIALLFNSYAVQILFRFDGREGRTNMGGIFSGSEVKDHGIA